MDMHGAYKIQSQKKNRRCRKSARKNKVGIWENEDVKPIPPWKWRKIKRLKNEIIDKTYNIFLAFL